MILLVLGALLSLGLVLAPLWAWYYFAEGDVEDATRRTSSMVFSLATGVAIAGMAIASEFAAFLGEIGTVIASSPSTITHSLLAVIGYASLSGILSLQPETFALLAIGLLGAMFMMR